MSRKPNTAGIKIDPNEIEYESMVFYISWYKQLLKLSERYGEEIFIRGFEELCEYSFHGVVPDNSDNPVLEMFFDMARASIDANIKLRIAGKIAADARWGNQNKSEEKPKRGRKKKEEPKLKEEPAASRFDIADDEWLEPTDENIAKMQAEWEQRQKANGESGNL